MRILYNLIISIMVLISFHVNSATPLSGSIIENRAEVVYYDEAIKDYNTKYSNVVSLTIATIIDFELTPKELILEKFIDEKFTLFHQIENKSNSIIDINIKIESGSESQFQLIDRKDYIDINKNGVVDENDVLLRNDLFNSIKFNVNEVKNIIITGKTPKLIFFGDLSTIEIIAEVPSIKREVAKDSIIVITESELSLSGYPDRTSSFQGSSVSFKFDLENNSNADAIQKEVFIDSNVGLYIVLDSKIPANTIFENYEIGTEDHFVYHLNGSSDNSYTKIMPSDKSLIDKVAFLYDDFLIGEKEHGKYEVKINENASDFVKTIYSVKYNKNIGIEDNKLSDDMIVTLPEIIPEFRNFNDNYEIIKDIIKIEDYLNIKANVSVCNIDASIKEEYYLTINTKNSGDIESSIKVTETNSNSGIFEIEKIETRDASNHQTELNNEILELLKNDEIYISLDCNNKKLSTIIYVDPLSIVFDSSTDKPISNIKVILKGVNEFGDTFVPEVFDLNGVKISNEQITDENGYYFFPLVNEGQYKIEIESNENYNYPSTKPIDYFSVNRLIDASGSYGKTFSSTKLNEYNNIIVLDIPLDPIVNNNILIKKEADKDVAEVGDIVEYTVKISNLSDHVATNVKLIDTLPLGLQFISSKEYTYNLNKNIITFDIDKIEANKEMEISYKVLVKINATNGTGVNSAQVISDKYSSNVSKHQLDIQQESVFENPLIMGKVFKDCNDNKIKDEGEIGIPGVQIYLNNGYYAITDKNGNYKFYNLKAKTYAIRIDKSSLPKPYSFEIINNRNSRDPYSAFADLKYGELHRRDFRDLNCSKESIENIENRIKNIGDIKSEIEKSATRELNFESVRNNDLQNREYSGLIDEDESNINKIYQNDNEDKVVEEALKKEGFNIDKNDLIEESEENNLIDELGSNKDSKLIKTTIDLESFAKEIDYNNNMGFVDLEDNDIVSTDQISIRIKGLSVGKLQLLVNNEVIPEEKIGQTVNFKDKNLKIQEYVAIKLKTGLNIIEIRVVDPFGNVRGNSAIKVLAVGKLKKIKFNLPEGNKIPANNTKPFPVLISLTDENNLKVDGKYVINLSTTVGIWDIEDINDAESGIQATIENGEAVFDLIPPSDAQKGQLKASINDIEVKEDVFATTYLRDMFAVGIVEGMFNFNNESLDDNISKTGLEDEMKSFEITDGLNARVSLFLKGKIKGDYLLTLAYDNDKDSNEKLYKDIEPDEFYPIYGDSSINGFEAQSTSKLFVKIAKNNSYMMYGDFNTRDYTEKNVNIGNYNRTLTGLKHVYQKNKVTINYYISEESFGARIKEIESTGGFGPYNFSDGESVVEGSEKVFIVTKDRNTGTTISEEFMNRFTDYEINGFYDGIIFRKPIPTVDSDFNPIYIRIEYETESDGEKYLVYGVKGSYAITKDISFGVNYNTSREKDNEFEITSSNLSYDKNGIKANVELAESNNLGKKGYGTKVSFKYNKEDTAIDLRAETADENFKNEYSSVSGGKTDVVLKTKNKISQNINIKNNVYYTKENELNKENKSIKTALETSITQDIRVEAGVRVNQNTTDSNKYDSTMISSKITWQPEYFSNINTYLEYEQDIDISDINRLEFGAEYAISEKGTIYIKQERLSNLISEIEQSEIESKNTKTIIGTNYDILESTELYSEYRIDDAISQKDAEAAIGVRNKFKINEFWEGNVSLERIETVEGDSNSSSSLATTLQHSKSKDWKTTYRLQYSNIDSNDFYLASVGYIRKINENYSFLIKDTVAYEEYESSWRNKFQSGLAYRDNKTNELNLLFKYENDYIVENKLTDYTNQLSFQFNKQLKYDLTASGLYSLKQTSSEIEDYNYIGNWLAGRLSYDINETYDIGISGAYLFDNETVKNYVLGLEAGYLFEKNMWISLGYNFEGLSDNKYSNENFNSQGVYARFRLKLTEDNFKWLQ